jgi:hypothetical protein
MKDLPHHLKKLNRRVIRSQHREEMEDESFEIPNIPPQKPTSRQMKKKKKIEMRKKVLSRVPTPLTPDQKNKKMKKRVPVFDRTNNAKPKHAGVLKKKSPKKLSRKRTKK